LLLRRGVFFDRRGPLVRLVSITMAPPFKLAFVTGNKYKLSEVRRSLEGVAEIESVNLDLPEIQGTIEEIAIDKCHRAAEVVRLCRNLASHYTTLS